MEFIKEQNGIYYFEKPNGGKHSLEANSKKEAIEKANSYKEPNKVEILKRKLINQVKTEVAKRLTATDYKVIRHRDQLALIDKGNLVELSITNEEYETLLKERDALRNWSNEKEVEIESAENVEQIEQIEIEYSR